MKKNIFLTAILSFFIVNLNAQVDSLIAISLTPTVNGGFMKSFVHTVHATDSLTSKMEVSYDSSLKVWFSGLGTLRIGSGIYTDRVDSPLVTAGVKCWVRSCTWNKDTNSIWVKKYSKIFVLIPLKRVTYPVLKIFNITTNKKGAVINIAWDNGNDSCQITTSLALDPNYLYNFDSTWSVTAPGSKNIYITGMPEDKNLYFRIKIEGKQGGKDNIDTSFQTKQSGNKPPWLRRPIDSVVVTETTADFYGRGISSGSPTSVKAIFGKSVLSIDSISGFGESRYHLKVTNLSSGTNYYPVILAQNFVGKDSIVLGKITTLTHNTEKFSVITDSLVRQFGSTKIKMYGKLNLVKGTTAEGYGGLFTDENCGVGLQSSKQINSSFKEGTNVLYLEFEVDTASGNEVWGRFWGYDSKGGFDLNPNPQKVRIVNYKPITVGVQDEDKKQKESKMGKVLTSSNFVNSSLSVDSREVFKITNMNTGQTIFKNGPEIDISNLKTGYYLITNPTGISQKFLKQ